MILFGDDNHVFPANLPKTGRHGNISMDKFFGALSQIWVKCYVSNMFAIKQHIQLLKGDVFYGVLSLHIIYNSKIAY